MPINILYVHYGDNWIRGSEQLLLDLLSHLDRQLVTPIVWCNAPAMAAEARKLGIITHQFPFEHYFLEGSPQFSARRYWAMVREGLRLVNQNRIQLLHANSAAPTQWLVPVARTARIPMLVHLLVEYQRRSRFLFGLHLPNMAVGISQAVVDDLLRDGMPSERTAVIYAGIDTERLGKRPPNQLRKTLGIPPEAVTIATVGSLIWRKGHDILLKAFRLIQPLNAPVHLLVASDGPCRAELENQAKTLGLQDVVHFLGYCDDVGALFRDETDFVAMASRTEGFGLAFAEAGYFGLPAVGTAVGGVPEVIQNEITGLVVPAENPEAMAAAMRRLVECPETRRRMGAAAHRRVVEKFTVDKMVNAFHETYDRLAAIPASRLGWLGEWNGLRPYLGLMTSRLR